jgi:SSS family solute:Na+ symporter
MHLDLPDVVVGLFCAGALAASMSSGDAMAHAAASIAVRDGLVGAAGKSIENDDQRTLIRWGVFLVMLLAYALTIVAHYLLKTEMVVMLLYAYGAVVQFAPGLVAALYIRRVSGLAVLAGMVVGSAVTALFLVQPHWMPIELHAGLYGLAANILVMLFASRGAPSAHALAFLNVAATPAGAARSPADGTSPPG